MLQFLNCWRLLGRHGEKGTQKIDLFGSACHTAEGVTCHAPVFLDPTIEKAINIDRSVSEHCPGLG